MMQHPLFEQCHQGLNTLVPLRFEASRTLGQAVEVQEVRIVTTLITGYAPSGTLVESTSETVVRTDSASAIGSQ